MINSFEFPRGSYVKFSNPDSIINPSYTNWIGKRLIVRKYHEEKCHVCLAILNAVVEDAVCEYQDLIGWEEVELTEEDYIDILEGN